MPPTIKEWSTDYPTSQDDPVTTNQPTLDNATTPDADDGDYTRVSQIHTMRDKLDSVAKIVGDGSNLPSGCLLDLDSQSVHTTVSGEIFSAAEKVSPVSGDWLLIEDSASTNIKKRVQIGNLPGGSSSPLTTKGDIYTYDTADVRLPAGTDGQVLAVDSTESIGLKWTAVSGTQTHGDTEVFSEYTTSNPLVISNTTPVQILPETGSLSYTTSRRGTFKFTLMCCPWFNVGGTAIATYRFKVVIDEGESNEIVVGNDAAWQKRFRKLEDQFVSVTLVGESVLEPGIHTVKVYCEEHDPAGASGQLEFYNASNSTGNQKPTLQIEPIADSVLFSTNLRSQEFAASGGDENFNLPEPPLYMASSGTVSQYAIHGVTRNGLGLQFNYAPTTNLDWGFTPPNQINCKNLTAADLIYVVYNSATVSGSQVYPTTVDSFPSSPTSYNDEFEGEGQSALSSKWSWEGAGAPSGGVETWGIDRGSIYIVSGPDTGNGNASATDAHFLIQPCPSGDWSVKAKVGGMYQPYASPRFGITTRSSAGVGTRATAVFIYESNALNCQFFNVSGGTFGSSLESIVLAQYMQFLKPSYLRLDYNATTPSLQAFCSYDGINWFDLQGSSWSIPFTPAAFGLEWWNVSNNGNSQINASCDWFRVTQ